MQKPFLQKSTDPLERPGEKEAKSAVPETVDCQGGCSVNSLGTPICHHLAFWTLWVTLSALKFSDSSAGTGAIQVHTLGISHCSAIMLLGSHPSPLLRTPLPPHQAAEERLLDGHSCLQQVLSLGHALVSDTHRCNVPFPGHSVTLWTWSRPDPDWWRGPQPLASCCGVPSPQ